MERMNVYLWLIHGDVWQKPTQYCKAIILQLKKKSNIATSINVTNFEKNIPLPSFLYPFNIRLPAMREEEKTKSHKHRLCIKEQGVSSVGWEIVACASLGMEVTGL